MNRSKALVFDCFGVLYSGSRAYLYEQVAAKNLTELRDLNLAFDRGYFDEADYLESVARLTGASIKTLKLIFKNQHLPNTKLIAKLETWQADYKIGLLSNIGRGVMDELFGPAERQKLFDTVVLSSEVGIVKPDPAIYQLTAERLGVSPADCLMIDDLPVNVEGAREAGMKAVLFESTDQLADVIAGFER